MAPANAERDGVKALTSPRGNNRHRKHHGEHISDASSGQRYKSQPSGLEHNSAPEDARARLCRSARASELDADGNNIAINDGRAAFQSVFPKATGRILREALAQLDATPQD